MSATVAALILFAFATGIFAVLSALEKPVYPLMWNHAAPVPDDETRQVHAALKRFIHILPPTMMTTMTLALIALLAQLFQRGFDAWSWAALGTFLVLQGGIASILMERIRTVKAQTDASPIAELRAGTGRLAAIHHMGLAHTAIMVALLASILILA